PGAEDAGGLPGRDDVLHERVVRREPRAPGVVDDVRTPRRVRVVAVDLGGREDPLARGDQVVVGAGVAAVGRDPVRAGCDTDLVGVAVVADHRAHRVRAVTVGVARPDGAGAGDVEPVVVVGEGAVAVAAAVVVHERWVVVLHTGVDVGDGDALAGDAHVPDVVGVDVGDTPLDGVRPDVGRRHPGDRLHERVHDGLAALQDVPALRELARQLEGAVVDEDRVGDPARRVVDAGRLEGLDGVGLRGRRRGGELLVDSDAAGIPVGDGRGAGEVRSIGEPDPEVCRLLLGQRGHGLLGELVVRRRGHRIVGFRHRWYGARDHGRGEPYRCGGSDRQPSGD